MISNESSSNELYQRAYTLYNKGHYKEAKNTLSKIGLEKLNNPTYVNLLSLCHINLNNTNAAVDILLKGIQAFPTDKNLINNYTKLLLNLKQYKSIIQYIECTLPEETKDAYIYLTLAHAYHQLGKNGKSLNILKNM